jgi:hypothetical protein
MKTREAKTRWDIIRYIVRTSLIKFEEMVVEAPKNAIDYFLVATIIAT